MAGKEMVDGLGEMDAIGLAGGPKGDCKEAAEECAEGSKRESFFIFLRGLLNFGGQSESEPSEPKARAICCI